MVGLLGNVLGSPWDAELARLRIALADGPDAVTELEPSYPSEQPVVSPPGAAAGNAADRLAVDLRAFRSVMPGGGGSNSWALAAARTASGRPLLANDAHLPPESPASYYLAHLRTPEWEVAGGSFAGAPVFGVGHNGFCAWGNTLGLVDNADLFVEEVGADGRSVREGDGFAPCPVHEELIEVRGGEPVLERVLETPRGPIVGPAVGDEPVAVSLRAVWLDPLPVRGMLTMPRVRSVEDFRAAFSSWPAPSLNVVYADGAETIAWQLVGGVPHRSRGGAFPQPGWTSGVGWPEGLLSFEELGIDWVDGYRMARVVESLQARSDWTRAAVAELQLDHYSLPWRELCQTLLGVTPGDHDAALALELLRDWDRVVVPESAAAAVYELTSSSLSDAAVSAKARTGARWAHAPARIRCAPRPPSPCAARATW